MEKFKLSLGKIEKVLLIIALAFISINLISAFDNDLTDAALVGLVSNGLVFVASLILVLKSKDTSITKNDIFVSVILFFAGLLVGQTYSLINYSSTFTYLAYEIMYAVPLVMYLLKKEEGTKISFLVVLAYFAVSAIGGSIYSFARFSILLVFVLCLFKGEEKE